MPVVKEKKGLMSFSCPECEAVTLIARISPKGLRIRKRLERARARYHRMINVVPWSFTAYRKEKQLEIVQELERQFREEVEILNN
jgi:hypothetical protein